MRLLLKEGRTQIRVQMSLSRELSQTEPTSMQSSDNCLSAARMLPPERHLDSTLFASVPLISGMPPRRPKKDSPAKLAGRMKRRWRVVLLRAKGEILGEVEAPDVASAKAVAAVQFDLDEIQRGRIMVQELG
jgi:hypothetical protein